MPEPALLAVALAAVWTYVTVFWLVSLVRKDASIMDIGWGPGFVLVVLVGLAMADGAEARRGLVAVLTAVWALRLAGYLSLRNRREGEDRRYAKWRAEAGPAWWWQSYFKVFLLQGTLLALLAAPLLLAVTAPTPEGLTVFDALGAGLWGMGMFWETVGDAQLMRFKKGAGENAVLDTGLWRYTRHPNYFGEAVLWWGYGLMALSVPGGLYALASPLLMTFLLLKVSGVALLEGDLNSRKPKYAEYRRRTPVFVPWFPKP